MYTKHKSGNVGLCDRTVVQCMSFSEPVVCILSGLVLCILSGLGRSYIVYNNQTHAVGHIPFKNAVLKPQS